MINAAKSPDSLKYQHVQTEALHIDNLWAAHHIGALNDIHLCWTCDNYTSQSKGGLPAKPKRGRPYAISESPMMHKDTSETPIRDLQGQVKRTPSKTGEQSQQIISTESCTPKTSTPKFGHLQTTPDQTPLPEAIEQGIQTTPTIDTSMHTSLERSIQSPLSKKEESLHTYLTKRKLNYGRSDVITCKTGGQTLVLKRVAKPRKPSAAAAASVIKKRAQQLAHCRRIFAGSEKKSTESQQSAELKSLSRETRLRICANAGVRHHTYISKHVS